MVKAQEEFLFSENGHFLHFLEWGEGKERKTTIFFTVSTFFSSFRTPIRKSLSLSLWTFRNGKGHHLGGRGGREEMHLGERGEYRSISVHVFFVSKVELLAVVPVKSKKREKWLKKNSGQ